jgi:beta-lactamase class A
MRLNLNRRQCLLILGAGTCTAAERTLSERWRQIARETDGSVGAAALHLTTGEKVSLNGDERFPLASVCKLPIAMNMFSMVDEGKLALDEEIEILPRDVWSGVSDLEKRWPAQRRFPLIEMIRLMVARSDNTAVETLFRIGGAGPGMSARFREWKSMASGWIAANGSAIWTGMVSSTTQFRINGQTH